MTNISSPAFWWHLWMSDRKVNPKLGIYVLEVNSRIEFYFLAVPPPILKISLEAINLLDLLDTLHMGKNGLGIFGL